MLFLDGDGEGCVRGVGALPWLVVPWYNRHGQHKAMIREGVNSCMCLSPIIGALKPLIQPLNLFPHTC